MTAGSSLLWAKDPISADLLPKVILRGSFLPSAHASYVHTSRLETGAIIKIDALDFATRHIKQIKCAQHTRLGHYDV